jgi:hypothetical protein
MSADYNLYIKKNYPEPDECIYGVNIGNCFSKAIIQLLFQTVSECDCVRDEWNDVHFVKVSRNNFIIIREFLLCNKDIDDFTRGIVLEQLNSIIDDCSDTDRLILEVC